MSIKNILKRINDETESAVQEILEKARADASRIKREYSEKASELDEELGKRAERRAEEEKRRLIVSEQLELRKAVLAKKRKILDGLYSEALKEIGSTGGEDYLDIVRELILERAVSGGEEIIVPEDQRDLFKPEFVKSLNEAFPGGGRFSIAEELGGFKWGVVLREERRVVDLSLGVLFEQLKEKIEAEVAAAIFPD